MGLVREKRTMCNERQNLVVVLSKFIMQSYIVSKELSWNNGYFIYSDEWRFVLKVFYDTVLPNDMWLIKYQSKYKVCFGNSIIIFYSYLQSLKCFSSQKHFLSVRYVSAKCFKLRRLKAGLYLDIKFIL